MVAAVGGMRVGWQRRGGGRGEGGGGLSGRRARKGRSTGSDRGERGSQPAAHSAALFCALLSDFFAERAMTTTSFSAIRPG